MSEKSSSGVDALAEQVHRQGDQVDVAGALAVAEQAALDAVGAGHHPSSAAATRSRGRCAGAATAPRVAVAQMRGEPLDHVGVHVGRVHLDRGRQVHDQLALRRGLDDLGHGVADLDGVLDLGAGEALGRVLVADVGVRDLLELAAAAPR
jgi:hypothetical protein